METAGLLVTLPNPDEGSDDAVVMNHSMHKIAYVVDIGKCTCFIVKRDGLGKYKCHSFECSDSKLVGVPPPPAPPQALSCTSSCTRLLSC